MEKTLIIKTEQMENQEIFLLSGRLDTLGARELDDTLRTTEKEKKRHLLLDMKEVSFLSSAGIRILIKYYKQCRQEGGECMLTNVPEQARGVLKMVGLEQLVLTGTNQITEQPIREFEAMDVRFREKIIHRESAGLIRMDALSETPPSLHSYDMAIGNSKEQEEFIILKNQLISGKRETNKTVIPAYYIGVHGTPSHFYQFTPANHRPILLSLLAKELLRRSGNEGAGLLIYAKSAGIIGVRTSKEGTWLPSQPLYKDRGVWIAGIIHNSHYLQDEPYTRILNPAEELAGHLHAAISTDPFRHPADPQHQLRNFPPQGAPLAVLHLVSDNRPLQGCGESLIHEGYAWITGIKTETAS